MQSSEYEELDMREILQILRSFGDDFHQAKEESALFPAFTAACDLSQTSAVRLSLISI
jgi:hemerythrin-like domain-containing protein